MKKRSLWIAVLLLCVCACLWGVACKKKEREVLATPQNLKIENEYLTWDEIENAMGYMVDINGELYETESNSLDIFLLTTEVGTYEMKVVSIGDGDDTIDSDWSETIEYVLSSFQFQSRKTKDQTGYEIRAYKKDALKGKVVFPSEIDGLPVKRIVNNGFSDCTNIEGIILPDSIVELGASAFSGCTSLKRIYLSDELEKIGVTCFADCVALTEIEIPAFVSNNISGGVFANCGNLTSIKVDEANSTYRSENNCLIKNEGDVLVRGCKDGVIPESVKKIGAVAFSGVNLTEITIPKSVKEIGDRAFSFCNGLTKITVPGNVKKVGGSSFSNCPDLEEVIFKEGVKHLGLKDSFTEQNIFSGCPALQLVQIPSTVEWMAIDLMKTLMEDDIVELSPYNQTYIIDSNCLIRKKDKALVCVGAQFVIPDHVTKIETLACANTSLPKTLVLPNAITTIASSAFVGSIGLENIILPKDLKIIEPMTFANCKDLKFVHIPKGVTKIGAEAFYGCSSLSELLIPDSVQWIETGAFKYLNMESGTTSFIKGLYTTHETIPAGWVDYANIPVDMFTSIMYGCTFGEENGVYYVSSWKRPLLNIDDNIHLGFARYPSRREGYTFKGWSLEKDSDEVFIGLTEKKGETVMDLYPLPQKFKDLPVGTVLYAVWEKNA